MLARFLAGHAKELDLRIVEFKGGSLRNAIPREGFVTVAVPAANQDKLASLYNYYTELLSTELGKVELNIVTFNEETSVEMGFSSANQARFIAALNACPNGVIRIVTRLKVLLKHL